MLKAGAGVRCEQLCIATGFFTEILKGCRVPCSIFSNGRPWSPKQQAQQVLLPGEGAYSNTLQSWKPLCCYHGRPSAINQL